MAFNFNLYAGDTKTIQVSVVDDNNNTVNLSGMTARWQLSKAVNRPALIKKNHLNGIQIINASTGRFDVNLDPNDTENLRPGTYYHEAEVIDSFGEIFTILTGNVTLMATLIKPPSSP